MVLFLELGNSLGEEGAVQEGECKAGKAKTSWLRLAVIAGQ